MLVVGGIFKSRLKIGQSLFKNGRRTFRIPPQQLTGVKMVWSFLFDSLLFSFLVYISFLTLFFILLFTLYGEMIVAKCIR